MNAPTPLLLSSQIRTLQTWECLHLCPVGILPPSLSLSASVVFTLSSVSGLFISAKPIFSVVTQVIYIINVIVV